MQNFLYAIQGQKLDRIMSKNINICLVIDCLPLPLLNRDLDRSKFANGNKSGNFTPTLFVSQKDISKDILQ